MQEMRLTFSSSGSFLPWFGVLLLSWAFAQSAGPANSVVGQHGSFTHAMANSGAGTATPTANGFWVPTCVVVDVAGRLYVCDQVNISERLAPNRR